MKYEILSGESARELEEKVIKYLNNGYVLIGGHQVTTVGYNDYTNATNSLREISPNRFQISQSVYKENTQKKII